MRICAGLIFINTATDQGQDPMTERRLNNVARPIDPSRLAIRVPDASEFANDAVDFGTGRDSDSH